MLEHSRLCLGSTSADARPSVGVVPLVTAARASRVWRPRLLRLHCTTADASSLLESTVGEELFFFFEQDAAGAERLQHAVLPTCSGETSTAAASILTMGS